MRRTRERAMAADGNRRTLEDRIPGAGRAAPGSAFVISLDFELHWGVHDVRTVSEYRDNLLGVREAVPAMLRLFRESDIHATWATVGLLLCASKRELLDALPARLPAYARPELSLSHALADVGRDEREDPFHFAPSLIQRIADTPHQEIGTHTLSHYYCLEAGQSPADFRADLQGAIELARRKLGRRPESIVFPRNQISAPYLDVCRELGLVAYRGNLDRWAYRARPQDAESLLRRAVRLADAYLPITGRATTSFTRDGRATPVNVAASRYLRPWSNRLRHLDRWRLRRIQADLRDAARRGRVFHLWWHPHDFGAHLRRNLSVLQAVLTSFARLRDAYGMQSLTMVEAVHQMRAS